ncbi:MAG: response regulator transcription factor [Sulfuricella sp.]|nr:response regulator transcription factor [Sulfuricella sp.]
MDVFIAEDSALMRERLESLLAEVPDVAVIGHAVDESGAIERIDALLPDVVILDLNLQSGSGIDVLKSVKARHTAIKVAVLTNHADEVYRSRCMSAGADYFFDKTLQFMEIGAVLKELAAMRQPGEKNGSQ